MRLSVWPSILRGAAAMGREAILAFQVGGRLNICSATVSKWGCTCRSSEKSDRLERQI